MLINTLMLINTRLANISYDTRLTLDRVDLISALHLILIVFCQNEPYNDPLNEVDLFSL